MLSSRSRPLRKIGIGLFITALSFVVIVMIQGWIDAGLRPHINWQFLAYVVLTLGEAMVSITGLEFSYTQAPNTMKSSVMALWLLTVASGELFVGLVNKWILGAGAAAQDQRLSVLYLLHLVDVWSRCRLRCRRLFLQGPHLPTITAHAR